MSNLSIICLIIALFSFGACESKTEAKTKKESVPKEIVKPSSLEVLPPSVRREGDLLIITLRDNNYKSVKFGSNLFMRGYWFEQAMILRNGNWEVYVESGGKSLEYKFKVDGSWLLDPLNSIKVKIDSKNIDGFNSLIVLK